MAVSVVTGAINSVVSKLNDLLGNEVSSLVGKALLGKQVKLGIQYLRNELSSMKAVLLRLSDMEEHMDPQTKEWRDRVRDMSVDIEDCIDRFMQRRRSHESSEGGGLVKKAVGILKGVWDDFQTGKEIDELKAMVAEESERRSRYNIDQCLAMHPPPPPVPLDQAGLRTQYEAARNLVGIDAPREKIFGWLGEQDARPSVVAIFGIGGSGKTTLASADTPSHPETIWFGQHCILDLNAPDAAPTPSSAPARHYHSCAAASTHLASAPIIVYPPGNGPAALLVPTAGPGAMDSATRALIPSDGGCNASPVGAPLSEPVATTLPEPVSTIAAAQVPAAATTSDDVPNADAVAGSVALAHVDAPIDALVVCRQEVGGGARSTAIPPALPRLGGQALINYAPPPPGSALASGFTFDASLPEHGADAGTHENELRKRRVRVKRAADSASKVRRSGRIADRESPYYCSMTTRAMRIKASRLDISEASPSLKSSLLAAGLCDDDGAINSSDQPASTPALARVAVACGADTDDVAALLSSGAPTAP